MTLMFCAFNGSALILRLYGSVRAIHVTDPEWSALYALFKPNPAPRQIFDMHVDLVQTSCGTAVPFFDYVADREELNQWAQKKSEKGIREYWLTRNELSVDGKDTGIRTRLAEQKTG